MANIIDEQAYQRGAIVAFRAPRELLEAIELAAAKEGLSRSDVARRACLRDLAKPDQAVA